MYRHETVTEKKTTKKLMFASWPAYGDICMLALCVHISVRSLCALTSVHDKCVLRTVEALYGLTYRGQQEMYNLKPSCSSAMYAQYMPAHEHTYIL